MPAGAGLESGVASSIQIALEAPAVTEEPTPTPTPIPPDPPVISVEGASRVEGGVSYVENGATVSWSVTGEVAGFSVTLYDAGGSVVQSANLSANSIDIPASMLAAGQVYTLEVIAVPAGAGLESGVVSSVQIALEAPQVTQAPTQMPSTIDQYSDPQSIYNMQLKLQQLGMLDQNNLPQQGVFDQATREAVLRFQQSYNAQNPGAPLVEIDPMNPDAMVDATTLTLLMNAA